MDIVNEFYNKLSKAIWHMTISDRCDLQKLLNKAIRMNDANCFLSEIDERNFKHHINQFESDIFLIESKIKERVLLQIATIQIAADKITEIYKDTK